MKNNTVVKRIKRLSALLLAGCLMLGTLQAGAAQVNGTPQQKAVEQEALAHSAEENDPLYARYNGGAPSDLYGAESDAIYMYGAPANSKRKLGMDVSQWQGNINWRTAKAAGIKFVIIRVGYRGLYNGTLNEDPRCREYIRGAKAAGIPVGVYMFSQAVNNREAIEEAKFALKIIKDYDIDLPVVIDREYSGTGDGRLYDAHLSRAQETSVVNAFCDTVANAGRVGMLYTGFNWLTYQINAKAITSRGHKVWIARWWYVPSAHNSPEYDGEYDFWQWSADGNNKGPTYGCSSRDLDLDYWYDDGSLTGSANKLKVPTLRRAEMRTGGVKVTWAAVPGAEYYSVYRRLYNESEWTYCARVNGATSYTDTAPMKSGYKYYYTVRAHSDKLTSGYDGVGVSVRYLATPVMKGTSNQSDGIRISWAEVKGANSYLVYRRLDGTSDWEELGTTTKLRITDKKAKNGKTYQYTVRALNGSDMSYYQKNGVSGTRLQAPEIKAILLKNNEVRIAWDRVKSAKGYEVYRKSPDSDKWVKIATVKGGSTVRFDDTSALKNGKTYYYSIRAYAGNTKSCYNTKGTAFRKLATPKLTDATSSKAGVTLNWNAVKGAKQYFVFRKSAGSNWTAVAKVKDLSYVDTTVERGKTYSYTIRAFGISWSDFDKAGMSVVAK